MMNSNASADSVPDSGPWWKYPLVWMVISGPACVVVAVPVSPQA